MPTVVFSSRHAHSMLLIRLLFYQLRELGEKGYIPPEQAEYTAILLAHTEGFLEQE